MAGMLGTSRQSSAVGLIPRVEIRPLMRLVYVWMTLGLLATAGIAWLVSGTESLRALALNPALLFGAIIIQLVLVISLSAGIRRLSPNVAGIMFFVYAGLNGFTLSMIFLAYELGTIGAAFLTAAAVFAAMTVVGFVTTLDLSQYRTYFIMGLIGMLIVGVVNGLLVRSSGLDLLWSIFGVLLFTGLTAYDTQKIKNLAADPSISGDSNLLVKLSILGALSLYLDFINLFLLLLRLFGRRH